MTRIPPSALVLALGCAGKKEEAAGSAKPPPAARKIDASSAPAAAPGKKVAAQKLTSEARREFGRALREGRALQKRKKWADSMAALEKAVAIDPTSDRALSELSWSALQAGELDRTAGDVDYVYATSSSAAPLSFRYVDLSEVLGPQTRGFSAFHIFGDRVYMGFPDSGGARPYLVALLGAPPAPGLDATAGTDAVNLIALTFSRDDSVYAAVGSGADAVRIHRLQ